MSDLFGGLRPTAPPPELRGRVLAAAREAASERRPGLLEMLIADRAVRISVAVVGVLFVAHLLVGRDAGAPGGARPTPLVRDEAAAPAETGLTAAEQIRDLEPAL